MADSDPATPASPELNAAPQKRSRNSDPPTGSMSGQKREKYTMTACYECRKRKIKCTGSMPCRRCKNYSLCCEYSQRSADTAHQSSSKAKIASLTQNLALLQTQVEKLSTDMRQMRETSQHVQSLPEVKQNQGQAQANAQNPPNTRRSFAAPTKPRFIGPTSSAYNFNVANNTLQMMGIQADEAGDHFIVASPMPSRCPSPEPTAQVEMSNNDPLLSIVMEETYRALNFYQEEIHPIYPFVPVEGMLQLVPSVYEHIQHKQISDPIGHGNDQCCAIKDQDVQVLKLIISCALVVEGRGQSRVAQLLVDTVDSGLRTSARKVEIDLQGLRIFTLTSIFYFHSDEPVLAWRTIGFAARIALEIGLHRRESLEQSFPDPHEREWAIKLFWCIYVLDRRWSFGIGMPFALQESDIDPSLPHLYDSEPYLECLIAYGKICSKVWAAVAEYSNKSVDEDTVAYLDFQIQQWRQSIPKPFQLIHPQLGEAAMHQPRNLQRLRVLLHVRANQMRGFIHRHNVLSASNISENLDGARLVTDIAKDTIRVLVHLRETSTIYDTQQSAFNYFLVSAISAIFLAVCHAPAEFSHSCRNEFYSALGILKDLSAHSYISRRLWKSIQRLRSIAPKLGLAPIKVGIVIHGNDTEGTRESYAATRTYINSRDADGLLIAESNQASHPQTGCNVASSTSVAAATTSIDPMSDILYTETPNMHQMGNELTNLFEAFDNSVDGQQLNNAPSWITGEELNSLQGGVEISRLLEGFI